MGKKQPKVLFLSPYPYGKASSQRLKYEQYFDYFKENGFELETHSFVSNEFWSIIYKKGNFFKKVLYTITGYIKRLFVLFILRKYDIVYVHLWATPFGFPVYEYLVCKISKKVIYDIDDLIFLNQDGNKKSGLLNMLKGKRKSLYLIKNADHVITCTPYLNEFVKKYNTNTTDISSTIDTQRFIPVDHYSNKEIVTIGWTGTHSTLPYLMMMADTLRKVREKRNFKLIAIGNFECNIEGLEVESIQWTAQNEISDLHKINIGIYPLPMIDWVMGKSGLKALQYMALGIPAVATNIGTIHRIIEHNKSGILVSSTQEWIDSLIELIDNPQKRASLGIEGRKVVENKFSIIANRDTYLNILKQNLHK